MCLVARRERELDLGLRDRDVHPFAVVLDRDDVHALLGDERSSLISSPGRSGIASARRGSGPRRVSPCRMTEMSSVGSMLPPERTAPPVPVPPTLPASSAATPTAPGALDDELRALEQQHDRLADLLVGHRRRCRRAGRRTIAMVSSPGTLDRDPVRDRVADRLAGERRARRRLDPTMRRGLSARSAVAMPAREPAAADRDSTVPTSGTCSSELEPDRSLAGDHELDPRTGGRTSRPSRRRTQRAASSASSNISPAELDLARRSSASPRPSPSARRRARRCVARMPASRAAHATACPWLPALAATTPAARSSCDEQRDAVDGAADLEGAGALEVLGLEQHLAARAARERLGDVDRRHLARFPRGARAPPRCQQCRR